MGAKIYFASLFYFPGTNTCRRCPGSGDRVRVVTDDASDGDGVTEYWSSVSSLCDVITLLSKVERPLHFVIPQKEEGNVQIGKK